MEDSNYYCLQRPAFVDNIMPGTDTSLVFGAILPSAPLTLTRKCS